MVGYLFGYPASKKQDAPGEGYPDAERGPAELLSYSIFSVSVNPVRILSLRLGIEPEFFDFQRILVLFL